MSRKSSTWIVILNWNGYKDTLACLESLGRVNSAEILVVDNGSSDASVSVIKQRYPGIAILETGSNLGYAGGNNAGMQYALEHNAEYILILNNDTVVEQNFLLPLITALRDNPDVAAVSPKIYYYEDKKRIWFIDGPVNLWRGTADHAHIDEVDKGQFSQSHNTGRLAGTAMLIRCDVLKKVGLFDEGYFLYWEETEWSLRVRKLGYRLLVEPSSVIWHNESRATGGRYSPLFLYYHTRNRLFLEKKYGSIWQSVTSFLYWIQIHARILVHLARRSQLSRRHVSMLLAGYRDGMVGRSGAKSR